jgi:RNA polymerase sigma factor (sigma-70 family)
MSEGVEVRAPDDGRVHDAWREHHERLWRAVLAWSGDREVASDAVAEAFAQAIRRGAAIDDVGAWVWRAAFRIAGGLLADRGRTSGPLPRSEGADGTTLPDDAVVLIDALGRVGTADRELVVLSVIGGWSAAEIGALLDVRPGTVRVRLHRAMAKLRDLMEDDDG